MKKNARPLFLEIPDRHGFSGSENSIGDFIEKSIGVKLLYKRSSDNE
jgi:vacuolar-type H+-ATPase subunit F/Vma7